ncbi:exodeoxyribonuclease VII small subunit [Pusillimonas sp.]|uniref:exodeoxyribonuclease VII small subunit n=1 Tax=Pusillimonas sp. TaxID=3040095 RepID=UPI0037CAAA58
MVDDNKTRGAGQGEEAGAGNSPAEHDLPQDYETALSQLEALVSQMENGSLSLDQSLAAYQKGVELARICQRLLDTAEQQVKVLQDNLLKPLDEVDASNEG